MSFTETAYDYAKREREFGERLSRVLSPERTIQSAELLRGRAGQLDEIRRAFYAAGRQIFIYGHRGVGKSSLAQTAAIERQSSDRNPIMLSCSTESTCFSVTRDLVSRAIPADPRLVKSTLQRAGKFSLGGFGVELSSSLETGSVPEPRSLNDCVALLDFVSHTHSHVPVIVIDEFDLIGSKTEQANFANVIKAVADHSIGLNFIFCGIGESLDDLFNAHMSTHRYFHTVELKRLPYEPRLEIIDNAADAMGIFIDDTTRYRIAAISDGFPHYVHLLCEKILWGVFRLTGDKVTPEIFEQALAEAVQSMQPELKKSYEKATRKYTNDYETILWAAADGDELHRTSRDIFESYTRIMADLGKEALDRKQFIGRINNLKQEAYAGILRGTRAGWYEYREKIVRGYARLRAAQSNIQLEREHPLQPRRFNTVFK
jgi:Cdc6-like AAA superfamily ATPase